MASPDKLEPITAARKFIETYYPNCNGALLAGSVIRGEATETSDLDIIIVDETLHASYRESCIAYGWPVELFAHNLTSYKAFFESDYKRARPSLPRMVSEGIVLKDTGVIERMKTEANELLSKGPEEWSPDTIQLKRYFITDALDDFIGCRHRAEGIFIANTLAELVSEFVLRTNTRWVGASKWIIRSLRQYDMDLADKLVTAFDAFYRNDEKQAIIHLVDELLEPYGGRLFDGFSLGKSQ